MEENNEQAVNYIVYISAFALGAWWFWDNSSTVEAIIAGCISSFIIGGIVRVAIAVAFSQEDGEERSPLTKAIVFFIIILIMIGAIWANGGEDSIHY